MFRIFARPVAAGGILIAQALKLGAGGEGAGAQRHVLLAAEGLDLARDAGAHLFGRDPGLLGFPLRVPPSLQPPNFHLADCAEALRAAFGEALGRACLASGSGPVLIFKVQSQLSSRIDRQRGFSSSSIGSSSSAPLRQSGGGRLGGSAPVSARPPWLRSIEFGCSESS